MDRAFKWDVSANFSLNRSRIESLSEGKDIFGATISNTILNGQLNLMREGEEMFLFYGYEEDGYDATGRVLYKDHDDVAGITEKDRVVIGNPNPDFLLNFSTTFSYKGFSLSAFFQGSYGNDIYSLTMGALAYDYAYNGNVLRDVIDNYWTPDRPYAKYPNLLKDSKLKLSDRFVYDGSYLRLKNLELGYDIPCGKNSILKKARVYVNAQNLLTLTSYPLWDPDVNANGGSNSIIQGVDNSCYPTARTFSCGCKLTF